MTTTDNLATHQATYESVLRLFKFGVPVVAVIAAFVVYLISH